MIHILLYFFFFFNDTATTEIYTRPYTLSLHDALPISTPITSRRDRRSSRSARPDSARAGSRSEEHTSELQSHGLISYAVFCLKNKKENLSRKFLAAWRRRRKVVVIRDSF